MTPAEDDPIVEEVHRVREAIAAAHGNDIRAIVAALRAEQGDHAELVVSREPRLVTRK
jgi:hypothetical protein